MKTTSNWWCHHFPGREKLDLVEWGFSHEAS